MASGVLFCFCLAPSGFVYCAGSVWHYPHACAVEPQLPPREVRGRRCGCPLQRAELRSASAPRESTYVPIETSAGSLRHPYSALWSLTLSPCAACGGRCALPWGASRSRGHRAWLERGAAHCHHHGRLVLGPRGACPPRGAPRNAHYMWQSPYGPAEPLRFSAFCRSATWRWCRQWATASSCRPRRRPLACDEAKTVRAQACSKRLIVRFSLTRFS